MSAFSIHSFRSLILVMLTGAGFVPASTATDTLPRSSHVGPSRMPLTSYDRIPIGTLLAHPDRYQMRHIRVRGTVTATQTEIITNRMICGFAHEQTTLTVEDESGQIELIERGACGKNMGQLRAPMLQVGQQIDLLVVINIPNNSGTPSSFPEATIRFIALVRE